MNTVNQERLKQSRQKVTITGESRVAYARREITLVTPISERFLRDTEDLLPAPIFIFGDRYYTARQLTLMYLNYKEGLAWNTLIEQWSDPDTDDDIWPKQAS
jgi:hypothetical protein